MVSHPEGLHLPPSWRLSGVSLRAGWGWSWREESALFYFRNAGRRAPRFPCLLCRGKPRARGLIQPGCAAWDAATSHLCRGTAAKAKNLSEEEVVEEGVAAGPELRHSRGELPFTPEELVVAAQHGPRRRRG